jgi:hypothetical protein
MDHWPVDDLGDCLQEPSFADASTYPPGDDRYTDFISSYVDSLNEVLRPINLKIHDNPELCYEEHIAHETLVGFLKTRPGWKVTPSAYGIATAFIAELDVSREGPVVSFNAEYGKMLPPLVDLQSSCLSIRCTSQNWPRMWS